MRYSFSGENADSINKSLLFESKRLESEGVDSETIRKETGWFKGYDGKWRYEIDDSKSVLIENPNLVKHTSEDGEVYFTGKLSDVLEHVDLYNAYPELRDINIVIQPTEFGVEGIFQPKSNYITLSIKLFERYTKEYKNFIETRNEEAKRIEQTEEYKEYNKWYEDEELGNLPPEIWLEEEKKARDQFYVSELGKRYYELKWGHKTDKNKFEFGWTKQAKAVLIHELQHAIQNIEQFASGASNSNKNYDRVAGEIEARDVANRLDLSETQRKENRPDIDRADVVYADENSISMEIVTLENGKQYVKATGKQVISGSDPKQWAVQVAKYINTEIRNWNDFDIVTVEGDVLTITKDTAYKSGHRNQIRNPDGTYRTMTDSEYRVKLNAEVHINELAEVSKKWNKSNVPDRKNHKFAKNGFNYRTAYFEDYDGQYYKITISVGENGKIATVYNVGKLKKDTLPTGKIISSVRGSKANSVSYFNIIPNIDEGVKKNSLSNGVDDIAPVGNFSTPLNELYYEDIGPVRKDIAPAKTATDTNVGGKGKASAADDDLAPVRKDIASAKTTPQLDDIAPVRNMSNTNSGQKNNTAEGDVNQEGVVNASAEENLSLKEQLLSSRDLLDDMDVVASVNSDKIFNSKREVIPWALEQFEHIGYRVTRENFGEVILDKKRVNNGARYLKTNEDRISFALVPDVIKSGIEIGNHPDHKNRNYDTVTFAAPVEINGVRGNMAVIVRQQDKNYYKVHRVLMPNGSQVEFKEKGDTAERAGGAEYSSGLSPADNVSTNSIPNDSKSVKKNAITAPIRKLSPHFFGCGDIFYSSISTTL